MMWMLREPSASRELFAVVRPGLSDGSPSIEPYAPCVVCGGRRPPLAELHRDMFCTTRCAREFYGCPLDPATERPAPKSRPVCGSEWAYKQGCRCDRCTEAASDARNRRRVARKDLAA